MLDSFWCVVDLDDDVFVSGTEEREVESYVQREDREDGSWRDDPFHLEYCLLVPRSGMGRYRSPLVGLESLGVVAWVRVVDDCVHCFATAYGREVCILQSRQLWHTRLTRFSATIPLRIFLNRGVVLAQMIAVLMALGTNTHTFYLPFYFQSAKGLTASQSGIRLLPYLLSVTAMELVTGTGVNKFGVYAPFMIFGTGIYIIASSLLCTLQVSTSTARLIGFQILAGMGFGSSLNICATVVRVNVQDKDIPIASALAGFAPFFGGSLAASIGQNVFRSALTRKLLQSVSPAEAAAIVKAGATGGVAVVEESMRGVVREAYNYAVKQTFVVPAVAGGLAFLCTLGLKWKNIRKPAKEVLNVVEAGEKEEKSG
jgi:hypothetical protein